MNKNIRFAVLFLVIVSAFSFQALGARTIKIGINVPMTGSISGIGKSSKQAAELWLEDAGAAGLDIGGKNYNLELVTVDNKSRAESAVRANNKMITADGVLAIVGPLASKQAVPAGETANRHQTPMLSPWCTNPNTTRDRSYVFRGCFLDPSQGPMLADFIKEEFGYSKAAVLYSIASDYSRGLAESFKKSWEKNGEVAAFESFTADCDSQLEKIAASGAEILFIPQYPNEIASIVRKAHELGWNKPIVGSDSWETVKLRGKDFNGLYFSTHYTASGTTGPAKNFADRYSKKHGQPPNDAAALTWDSLGVIRRAVLDCGKITGDLKTDRKCIRDALAGIRGFEGITGKMTFTEDGDPVKCAVIVKIDDEGEYKFFKSVCPQSLKN